MTRSSAAEPAELAWARWVDAGVDAIVFGFAGWTLLSHLVVLSGGTLRQLVWFAAVATCAAAVWIWRRPLSSSSFPAACDSEGLLGDGIGAPPNRWLQLVGLITSLALCIHFYLTQDLMLLWIGGALLSVAFAAGELRRPPQWSIAPISRNQAVALGLLCAVTVTFNLAARRYARDDAFYVNIPVYAADHPDQPLLTHDTMHGVEDVPLLLPIYRSHSIELLAGALTWLLGCEALTISHLLIPPLAALIVPLAYARLFRILMPTRWLWGVTAVVGYFLLVGDQFYSFSNLAIVRLHNGKSILLAVCVPLMIAYGLEFMKGPSSWRWFRLLAIQMAAIGVSSTALWLAPIVVASSLASGLFPTWRSVRVVLVGVASSGYGVLLGLWFRAETRAIFVARDNQRVSSAEPAALTTRGLALMDGSLDRVFGGGVTLLLVILAVLGLWSLSRSQALRRVNLVFTSIFLVVFFNPLTASWVTKNIVPNYWRIIWLLPIPALLAALLTTPAEWFRERHLRRIGAVLTLMIVSVYLILGPVSYTTSPRNRIDIGWPGWRVPEAEFAVAKRIAELSGPGNLVLAPFSVSLWLPTMRHHPTPLVVRPHYLRILARKVGTAEVRLRWALTSLVSGKRGPVDPRLMLEIGLKRFGFRVVALAPAAAAQPRIRIALQALGFERVWNENGAEIWTKSQP